MRRRLLSRNLLKSNKLGYEPINIPEETKDYAKSLRLLNDIPLTYLLTDIHDLEEESIRFGIVDVNWTDAYLDGAFSIGRVCKSDAETDKVHIMHAKRPSNYYASPRMKRMHANHKKIVMRFIKQEQTEDYTRISAVLIRSQLMKSVKGVSYSALGKVSPDQEESKELPILRIEEISDDILICLFSGIIDTFIIEEPMTGLKFGCHTNNNERDIDLRSTLDNNDFGKRLYSFSIENYKDNDENEIKCIDENGRIHAKNIAKKIESELRQKSQLDKNCITPSRFAYEMISVAHRAFFYANEK
ncbi:hypothetical protein IKQ19_10215 [Candidatus Saccharibacteria bacterium]|nr:hypothetical protein [Candidatus Saccharibacteria bacterium]